MIFDISKKPENSILLDGVEYPVSLAYDRVLNVYEVYGDDAFSDAEKADLALELLVPGHKKPPYRLLDIIFEDFILLKSRPGPNKTKLFDFDQDSGYIYAAFLQAYSIDIIDVQDKLDWRRFIWLFLSLPESTKIREIMSIRGRELPKQTNYNAEEIHALTELKAYYALDLSHDDRERGLQSGLASLAGVLIARAGGVTHG